MNPAAWLAQRLLGGEVRRQVKLALAETENMLTVGATGLLANRRDRQEGERSDVLEQCMEAWRVNPLARRIVELTSQYVVGGGFSLRVRPAATARFVEAFWTHRLNRMDVRCSEWCDELTRSGNLFVLISTDAAGMSYVRAVPAAQIASIESRPNDIEQPLAFQPRSSLENPNPAPWAAYDEANDNPDADGRFAPVMLHYTVNRLAGAQWGEPDLAPVLKWLSRYAAWLEDRARLNRFRNAYLYVVKSRWTSEAERLSRQNTLNLNPPSPGSILVADETESWEVISPKLESADASTDGTALKKMIAAGAGVPMHFLAEPESSTRTTAEAAGGPTFRYFEQRQTFFRWLIGDVLRVVINRRALVDGRVSRRAQVEVMGADISSRDNQALAQAFGASLPSLAALRDRGLIDDAELLRLAYRFAGEVVDVEEMLGRGRGRESG